MKNKQSEGKFYHIIDYRFKLNLNVDNRFAYNAPTVTKISPFKAHVRGGDTINIYGYNLGDFAESVSQVFIKDTLCMNPRSVSSTQITCTSGVNIFENGVGNVIVKMKNGLSSPSKTCKMFEYFGVLPKFSSSSITISGTKKTCIYTSPKIVQNISNLK